MRSSASISRCCSQYLAYMHDILHFDLGYSITDYPTRVTTIILHALPWTIGLLFTTTLLAFLLGTLLGALSVWRGAPRIFAGCVPLLMVLSAVPFYLFGLILIYIFATVLQWLPLGGGMGIRDDPSLSLGFALEILRHSILPAASILLASIGVWTLSMRGMMVTVQGEDYMTYAEALGLTGRRRFLHYGLRNAILPQITLLALSFGYVLSGSILVELVFGYPGVGQQLFRAIQNQDYFVIYGIVLALICALAIAMLAGGPGQPAARSAHPARKQARVSASASAAATAPVVPVSAAPRTGARGVFRALRRNPSFMLGLVLIALLIAFAVIGRFFVGWNDAFPLSAPPSMPPDGDWIFGTDADGRDLFAVHRLWHAADAEDRRDRRLPGPWHRHHARLRRRLSRRLARRRDARSRSTCC